MISPWPKRLWQISCRQGATWSISIRPTVRSKRSRNCPRPLTMSCFSTSIRTCRALNSQTRYGNETFRCRLSCLQTANVEHAVAAFEKPTVDYVLKPFSNESINKALDRAARRAKGERAAKLIEALPQLQKLSCPSRPMIAIQAKGRILLINPGDVVAVQAEGNYVSLQRESDSYLLRESISRVAEKLKPYGFIRIHRSALVNTTFVMEIKPYSTGKCGLRVKGGKEYAVTSAYKKNLKPLTEFRIGNGAFLME